MNHHLYITIRIKTDCNHKVLYKAIIDKKEKAWAKWCFKEFGKLWGRNGMKSETQFDSFWEVQNLC